METGLSVLGIKVINVSFKLLGNFSSLKTLFTRLVMSFAQRSLKFWKKMLGTPIESIAFLISS